MRLALLFVACALLAPGAARGEGSEAPADVLRLVERRPLAFVLLTPGAKLESTSSSEILRQLSEVLERTTDLALEPVDPASVAECAGQLGCMVQKLRGEARAAGSRHLLVLSSVGRSGRGDRLSATLVEIQAAKDELDRTPRDDPDWQVAAEAAIADRAVRAKTPWVEVHDEAEAAQMIGQLVEVELREALDAAGAWEPYGELELTNLGPGWLIEVDGASAGTTRGGGRTRVLGVRPGKRTLALAHPGYAPISAVLQVERAKVTRYDAEPRSGTSAGPAIRTGVVWGGAGVGLAGLAVLGAALVRHDSSVAVYCLGGPASGCASSSRFETAGYDPGATPTFADRVNPSGVMLAPLGYSLLGAGAVWSLGTLLFTEEGDVPWPELVAGAAVGVLAYGLSGLLEGDTAFAR